MKTTGRCGLEYSFSHHTPNIASPSLSLSPGAMFGCRPLIGADSGAAEAVARLLPPSLRTLARARSNQGKHATFNTLVQCFVCHQALRLCYILATVLSVSISFGGPRGHAGVTPPSEPLIALQV